jgi:1-acyl-sn-glycerol-3-phosphate acyltransferase
LSQDAAATGVAEITARPVQLAGHALARRLLRLAGWQVRFDGLPARQGVLIVYPHTSNWDFVVGVLAKWAIGIDVAFWGKDSLFRVPLFGRWLRWLGGIPVDRSSARGVVADTVEQMRSAVQADRYLWLALAPEGTRHYREAWRSGFWHVATLAKVPLGLAYIDYDRRVVSLEHFLTLSGHVATDMEAIGRHLGGRSGRHPHQAAPVRLEP